jgi:hypothetical protein
MYVASSQERQHTKFERQTADGKTIWRTDYFGPSPSPQGSNSVRPDAINDLTYAPPAPGELREPQAFLVEQSAGAIVHPHFHFVDQFQIVVDGHGKLGKHDVHPVTVHFAARHTGYGPIMPAENGLKYFTLRASADETGAQYLPANRHKMVQLTKKYLLLDPVPVSNVDTLTPLREVGGQVVYADETGLKVRTICAGPQQPVSVHPDSISPGVSVIVLAGNPRVAKKTLDKWSCAFVSATDGALEFESDEAGFELLVLQYPKATE